MNLTTVLEERKRRRAREGEEERKIMREKERFEKNSILKSR